VIIQNVKISITTATMELKPFWSPIIHNILGFYKMWRFPWQNYNGAKSFLKSHHNILQFYKNVKNSMTTTTMVPKPFWSRIIIFWDFTRCEDFCDKTTMEPKAFWSRIPSFCDFKRSKLIFSIFTQKWKTRKYPVKSKGGGDLNKTNS